MQRTSTLSVDPCLPEEDPTFEIPSDAQRGRLNCDPASSNCSKANRIPGQNGHPTDIPVSHSAQSVPSRRKRVRISPLSRIVTPQPKDDPQHHASDTSTNARTDLYSSEGPTALSVPQVLSQLNLIKIDPDIRDLIRKYVPSDSIVRCLELAGFTSPHVLACLSEAQIQRLEDFVGHACMLMDPIQLREFFIGPVFAQFPEHFRLPSGAICGLLLAADEIKTKFVLTPAPTSPDSVTPNGSGRVDTASQTELSIPSASNANPFLMLSSVYGLPALHNAPSSISPPALSQSMIASSPASIGMAQCAEHRVKQMNASSLHSQSPIDHSVPASDTVAIMAAAFQAAAIAASNNDYSLQIQKTDSSTQVSAYTSGSDLPAAASEHHTNTLELPQSLSSGFPVEPNSSTQQAVRLVAAVSGRSITTSVPSNSPNSNYSMTHYDEEVVDLDRLKQHSSASATRLASRQFLNAHLVRGRDFDMEMEISTTPEGVKRVTGIFYCHLCREKRERTSAVRFSIARNRYPVLSNVLSHLKTHFQYRGQLFTGSHLFSTVSTISNHSSGFNTNTVLPIVAHSTSVPPCYPTTTPNTVSRNAAQNFDPHTSGTPSTCVGTNTVARCDVNPPNFIFKGEAPDGKTNVNDGCTISAGRVRRVSNLRRPPSPSSQSQDAPMTAETSLTESSDGSTFNSTVDHYSYQSDPSTR
ncbi:unnamed protein product [Dicrocoelium dendriticum]|nr:unnamed protein product [Dicrocoelium dendriticum]